MPTNSPLNMHGDSLISLPQHIALLLLFVLVAQTGIFSVPPPSSLVLPHLPFSASDEKTFHINGPFKIPFSISVPRSSGWVEYSVICVA